MVVLSFVRRVQFVVCLAAIAVILSGCSQQSDRQEASVASTVETTNGEPLGASTEEFETFAPEESELTEAVEYSIEESGAPADDDRGGLANLAPGSGTPHASLDEFMSEPVAKKKSASAVIAPPRTAASAPKTSQPLETLPAGSVKHDDEKFARIKVFYATDRAPSAIRLSAYHIKGEAELLKSIGIATLVLLILAPVCWLFRRPKLGATSLLLGGGAMAASVGLFLAGRTTIEKHGVNYLSDRGMLTRGVCEVTVPVSHDRGIVERPSMLRFEFREDQDRHIVLTSAVEMQSDDFYRELTSNVSDAPQRDLLVFIHGYNVDFESAVQRTAQIAVDLPFEGVPVCYSWPSQGKLLSYSIDENNAQWTVTHLREFLLELAKESGADSINVVAHSMGNRAMTMAMQQIQHRRGQHDVPLFDRVVLAAPDVDADHFRRDLVPPLLRVANQVTLYASSDDRALIASKKVHGYPRAGESGEDLVVVPGVETVDVSGIDLSLLGHSYYGDNESMLRDLYEVVRARLPAPRRQSLIARQIGELTYWQLAQKPTTTESR